LLTLWMSSSLAPVITLVKTLKGVLLVKPGSPGLPLGLRDLGTVGILELNRGKAEAQVIQSH
jgi:hypothetical protein